MKSDRYLKAILTVIAICQVLAVGREYLPIAHADSGPVPVNIVEVGGIYATHPLAVHNQ